MESLGAAGFASFGDSALVPQGCTGASARGGLEPLLAKEGKHQVWQGGNGEQDIFLSLECSGITKPGTSTKRISGSRVRIGDYKSRPLDVL